MSIEENRAMALKFLDRLSAFDFDAMFDLLADDAVWRVAGRPESFPPAGTQSKSERREVFEGFVSVLRSLRLDVVSTTAEQDRVVVEFTGYGESPSGVVYENEFLSLFRFRDGKICSVYEHCDQQAVLGFGQALEQQQGS